MRRIVCDARTRISNNESRNVDKNREIYRGH